jgi:hypothetical protein
MTRFNRASLFSTVFVALVLLLSVLTSFADDRATNYGGQLSQAIRLAMHEGATPAANRLYDLLEKRFPRDFEGFTNALAVKAIAGVRLDEHVVAPIFAAMIAELVKRDLSKIAVAPRASLELAVRSQLALVETAADSQPEICRAELGGASEIKPKTKALEESLLVRQTAALGAIADGRDHPVEREPPSHEHVLAFIRDAKAESVDVQDWPLLSKIGSVADSKRLCGVLKSVYGALISVHSQDAEIVLADYVKAMLYGIH